MMEPIPLLTVGDLKSELSRWSNETPVTFYSPLKEQEFRFYRYRPGDSVLVLEINEFPETPPVVLPAPGSIAKSPVTVLSFHHQQSVTLLNPLNGARQILRL